MILKGNSVTGAAALARYLENSEKNERVSVIEIKGTLADDLHRALVEMAAYAEGTKCEKPLYHGKISPEPPYTLTREQALEAADVMEERLGLTGQPRVIVMHEHDGRQHYHPIWARIDLEEMRAIPDSHSYRRHEEAARELERRFGHPRVQGAHAERDHVVRPERAPSIAEVKQEERTGISGKEIKEQVTAIFRASDNVQAFAAALDDQGYLLARGDRRDYVLVDQAGGIHNLGRRIEGMKAADLRDFMKPLEGQVLLTAEEAKRLQLDRSDTRREIDWEDRLLQSALKGEAKDRQEKWENRRALEWDDKLIAAAEAKAKSEDAAERARNTDLRAGRQEARDDAILMQRYSKGADYVSQSTAALRDYKRGGYTNLGDPLPLHPKDHEEELLRRQAEETTKRQLAANEIVGPRSQTSPVTAGVEMTDARQARADRKYAIEEEEYQRDPDDLDRQHGAPGRGHPRSL